MFFLIGLSITNVNLLSSFMLKNWSVMIDVYLYKDGVLLYIEYTAIWRFIKNQGFIFKESQIKSLPFTSSKLLFCYLNSNWPVDWGCRIHWLHLCRGVRLNQWVFWWWSSSNGALEKDEYPFIAIAPRSTLAQSGSIS